MAEAGFQEPASWFAGPIPASLYSAMAFRYSEWDGTQVEDLTDVEEIFDALSDDLLQHCDMGRALRQLLHRGFNRGSGDRMSGIQDLLQRLRERRQEMLSRNSLDSLYSDLRQRLDDIVQRERGSIEQRLGQASDQPDDEQQRLMRDTYERIARRNLDALDRLPQDPAGRIEELRNYEFLDPQAGSDFQQLLQSLQQSVMDSFFKRTSQALQRLTSQDTARMKEMLHDLNQLLSDRIDGGRPDFDDFMHKHGEMFGPNPPRSLEELVEQMQQRMSQMQSLLNSLTPQQRESLLDLLSAQLFDDDLQEELSDLAANLAGLSPNGIQGQEYSFFGEESASLQEAMRLMEQMQAMEEVERQLGRVRFGASLDEVDKDLMQEALGPEAGEQLDELKRLAKRLEQAGYMKRQGDGLKLTARAMRKIGQKALRDIFERLRMDAFGSHSTGQRGAGPEPAEDTKPYEFGDTFHLDLHKTLRNALRRQSGVPIRLTIDDFEVQDAEFFTSTTTVIVLDVSRSMPMRGNFLAAKKVALALNALIRTQFPRDNLYVGGFSGVAREVDKDDLPRLNVGDFGRGTNVQAGWRVARRLLSRHRASRCQVVLITDGEPTAFYERDGRLSIEYPPGPRVLRETLREVRLCTREGITINTFMLEKSYHLRAFVSQLARANQGRVLFTAPEHLGRYILLDYVGGKARRRSR